MVGERLQVGFGDSGRRHAACGCLLEALPLVIVMIPPRNILLLHRSDRWNIITWNYVIMVSTLEEYNGKLFELASPRQAFPLWNYSPIIPYCITVVPSSPSRTNESSSMRACLGVRRSFKLCSTTRLLTPTCPSLRSLPTFPCQRRPYASAVSAAELQFGQSLHETHPHLLKPGERRNGYPSIHNPC